MARNKLTWVFFRSQLNGGVSGRICSSSVYCLSWVMSTNAPGRSGLSRSIICFSLKKKQREHKINVKKNIITTF